MANGSPYSYPRINQVNLGGVVWSDPAEHFTPHPELPQLDFCWFQLLYHSQYGNKSKEKGFDPWVIKVGLAGNMARVVRDSFHKGDPILVQEGLLRMSKPHPDLDHRRLEIIARRVQHWGPEKWGGEIFSNYQWDQHEELPDNIYVVGD